MQVQAHPVHQTWISYAISIGIIAIVMALRMRRMGQMRPLKLETLWIVPAIYLAVAALMFFQLAADGLGRDRLDRRARSLAPPSAGSAAR